MKSLLDFSSLPEIISYQAQKNPKFIAIEFLDQVISYEKLQQDVINIVYNIDFRLQGKQKKVGIFLVNPLDCLLCFLGTIYANHLACIVPKDLFQFCEQEFDLVIKEFPNLSNEKFDYKCDIQKEELFYLGFTSGSSGNYKFFARNHNSWIYSLKSAEVFEFYESCKVLISGYLSHSLFLFGAIHTLAKGGICVFNDVYQFKFFTEQLQKVDFAYVVPSMLENITLGTTYSKLDLTNLKGILSGGSKLKFQIKEKLAKKMPFGDIFEFFGSSETSFISYHSFRKNMPKDSVGKVFSEVRLEIIDQDKICKPFQEGDLFVESPMNFSEYFPNFHYRKRITVGDRGYQDREGFYI